MTNLFKEIRASIMATLVLAVFCLVYPLLVWVPGQLLFPRQANGSLIVKDGKLLGSELIGQGFSKPEYFHPRPSNAGNGYDAQNSGGSNLGPTSQKLMDTIKQNVANYRKENQLGENTEVPADAVTASASGLDPHISPANALLQAPRVAKARKLSERQLVSLIAKHTTQPALGIFGDPTVNVLMLNLDLDGKL